MTGWVVLIAACALTGGVAFALARAGVATFHPVLGTSTAVPPVLDPGPTGPELARPRPPERRPARPRPPRPPSAERRAPPTPPLPAGGPEPTTAPPPEEKLILWASQVEAGIRKMSIATDGCRVTWNRSCKHGHPSWLVHLRFLRAN